MPFKSGNKSNPLLDKYLIEQKITTTSSGAVPSADHYWPLTIPEQAVIQTDSAEYLFKLDDATPDTSVTDITSTFTLSKDLGGTISSANQQFNANGKCCEYDAAAHSGAVTTPVGTNDFYVEWDMCVFNNALQTICSITSAANTGISIYCRVRESTANIYCAMEVAGAAKTATWTGTDLIDATGWHRYRVEVDRDNDANVKLYIDGRSYAANSTTLDDYSATNFTGTTFKIGDDNAVGTGGVFKGQLSYVKWQIGAYTGSTTAWDQGLDPTTGAGALTCTRATIQDTPENEVAARDTYSAMHNLIGNPAWLRPDTAEDLQQGLLIEPGITNHATRNSLLSNGVWIKTNLTVTEKQTLSPAGTDWAGNLAATAANGNIEDETALVAANQFVTFSCWLKSNGSGNLDSTELKLEIEDNGGGEIVSELLDYDNPGNSATVTEGAWKRCYAHIAFSGAANGFVTHRIKIVTNGNQVYYFKPMMNGQVAGSIYHSEVPTSSFLTVSGSGTRNDTAIGVPTAALSDTFTWAAMMYFPYANTDWIAGQEINLFGTNSDVGTCHWQIVDDAGTPKIELTVHGSSNTAQAVTWNAGSWHQIGGYFCASTGKHDIIWDGSYQNILTQASASPTWTAAYLGNTHDGSAPCHGTIGTLRKYNSILSVAHLATVYSDMQTAMGLP